MLSAVGHHELGIFGTFFLGNLVVGGKLADDDGQVVGVGIRYHDIEFCCIHLTDISHFKALPLWLACYIVYGRHSEAKEIEKWEEPEDIDRYLMNFKQHSLRNPIVEQVVTETLRTVRDIWKQEGHIDEIHLELGRDMKNPADKRRKMTERIQQNENTNMRIKAMLMEFMNPELGIENVRPFSPSQQDIMRIYEEGALGNLSKDDESYDFVMKVSKMAQPSKARVTALWNIA